MSASSTCLLLITHMYSLGTSCKMLLKAKASVINMVVVVVACVSVCGSGEGLHRMQ